MWRGCCNLINTPCSLRRTFCSGHYKILGVKKTAGLQEIKKAYFSRAKELHPDASGDETADAFRQLQHAYKILSDESARRAYDGRGQAKNAPRRRPKFYTRGTHREEKAHSTAGGPRKAHVKPETITEVKIRTLIEQGSLREAVSVWAVVGAPLSLCEFLVEQCRLNKRFPSDEVLAELLDHLHSSEETTRRVATEEDNSAVSTFVERKTAYRSEP